VEKQEVTISFWAHDRNGRRISRTIAVPRWAEIAALFGGEEALARRVGFYLR
jgi:hypothetical protein